MFATFRRISSPYEKYAIPYIDVTKTIGDYENSFRKYHGDVTSGEFPSGIKTVHLKDMDITFKRIRVDEKGNVKDASTITDFMDAIVSTYNTSYEMHIRLHAKKIDEHGVSKDAREFALQTITAKLKSLHPILNGNGIYQDEKKLDEARGRDAFYLTPREKFYEFMRQKAINQHNPENTYTDVMVKGEKMYNARIDAVLLNWDIYLKENIKSDDYKHLLTLKPMIIDKIGDKYKLAFNEMEAVRDSMIAEIGIDAYSRKRKYAMYPTAAQLGDWLPMYPKPVFWKGYWEGYLNREMFESLKLDAEKIYKEELNK